MKTSKTSKASAALWSNANRRTSAERGLGDPADALHPVVTVKALIRQINTNPDALELLAGRRHELTAAQITAVLEAGATPKEPKARKVAKAKPRAMTPGARRIADIALREFRS